MDELQSAEMSPKTDNTHLCHISRSTLAPWHCPSLQPRHHHFFVLIIHVYELLKNLETQVIAMHGLEIHATYQSSPYPSLIQVPVVKSSHKMYDEKRASS